MTSSVQPGCSLRDARTRLRPSYERWHWRVVSWLSAGAREGLTLTPPPPRRRRLLRLRRLVQSRRYRLHRPLPHLLRVLQRPRQHCQAHLLLHGVIPTDSVSAIGVSRERQGSTIYFFALDNRSARACSVFGYVGVAAFNSQGASEPLVLQRDSSKPSRTVLLRPGASSFFQLQAGNPTNQSAAASCARATTLHVTPPDERAYIAIEAHDFTSCGNHTVTTGAVQGQ